MNSTQYTENVLIKLIFAFTAQSSLSKVRTDNVRQRNAVPTRAGHAVPTRQHPYCIHKPVPVSIIDDVMIVLY